MLSFAKEALQMNAKGDLQMNVKEELQMSAKGVCKKEKTTKATSSTDKEGRSCSRKITEGYQHQR